MLSGNGVRFCSPISSRLLFMTLLCYVIPIDSCTPKFLGPGVPLVSYAPSFPCSEVPLVSCAPSFLGPGVQLGSFALSFTGSTPSISGAELLIVSCVSTFPVSGDHLFLAYSRFAVLLSGRPRVEIYFHLGTELNVEMCFTPCQADSAQSQ